MKFSRSMVTGISLMTLLLLTIFTNCSSSEPDLSGMQKSQSSSLPTPNSTPDPNPAPQSSGPTVGAACASEGVIDYDLAQHKPVYCNETKIWRLVAADAPTTTVSTTAVPVQGTWCGYTTTSMPYPNGTWLNGLAGGGTVLCQGKNPATSCPTGYVQFAFCYESDHYSNCNNAITCIKQ